MRQLIHSTVEDVTKKEKISYEKMELAINKSIATKVNWDAYSSLKIVGIDEFAIKKGYNDYVTVISTKAESDAQVKVIAVLQGRLKDDVVAFLKSIPEHLMSPYAGIARAQ